MKVKDVRITNKIPNIKEGYYIEVTFMFGDADGYTTNEIGPFSDFEKDEMLDALATIQRCIDEYSDSGRCGYDEYNHIEGFKKWFSDDIDSAKQAIDMVYQPDGMGIQASFDDYTVYYYKNGEKYNCKVIYE